MVGPAVEVPLPQEGLDRTAELAVRYARYRRRQAERLVRLMPREAVRPLYRRALEAAEGSGGADDPLALLTAYCETLLPLPPFEVWCDDLDAHPDAHLADLTEEGAAGPSADAPTALEARAFEHGDRVWQATLGIFRDGAVWRGMITFREPDVPTEHRTAPIFCEADPTALRERFRSFDAPALEAFLRSTLP